MPALSRRGERRINATLSQIGAQPHEPQVAGRVPRVHQKLARPVIFGLCDGSMSILGVVLYASGHGGLVFPFALAGGVSAAVSMANGEYQSDSDNGFGAATAIGLATLIGSILPAVPYLIFHSWIAPAVALLVLCAIELVVARIRAAQAATRVPRHRPYLETFAGLGIVLIASVACALLIPGGAG